MLTYAENYSICFCLKDVEFKMKTSLQVSGLYKTLVVNTSDLQECKLFVGLASGHSTTQLDGSTFVQMELIQNNIFQKLTI